MAKIIKVTTGTVDVGVEEEFDSEDKALVGNEPNKAVVEITEFKIENTKWKRGKVENE